MFGQRTVRPGCVELVLIMDRGYMANDACRGTVGNVSMTPLMATVYTLLQQQRDYLSWPIVYFLQNKKDAYVGESTDVVTRMKAHLKTEKKQDFKSVSLILSDLFNKSATLDVESNLIQLTGELRRNDKIVNEGTFKMPRWVLIKP